RCLIGYYFDLPFIVHDSTVIDLFVVVVLAGYPEYGNRLDPLFTQTGGKLDYSEGLVNRVKGSGGQPGLLAGNNGNRSGLAKHVYMFERKLRRSGTAIYSLQRVGNLLTIKLPGADLPSVPGQRRNCSS